MSIDYLLAEFFEGRGAFCRKGECMSQGLSVWVEGGIVSVGEKEKGLLGSSGDLGLRDLAKSSSPTSLSFDCDAVSRDVVDNLLC
jgi:hypothetical protein